MSEAKFSNASPSPCSKSHFSFSKSGISRRDTCYNRATKTRTVFQVVQLQIFSQHKIIQFFVKKAIEMKLCTALQADFRRKLWVSFDTITRDKGSWDTGLQEWDDISEASSIGSGGAFHNILAGYGIWTCPPCCATIKGRLWNDLEAFGIG